MSPQLPESSFRLSFARISRLARANVTGYFCEPKDVILKPDTIEALIVGSFAYLSKNGVSVESSVSIESLLCSTRPGAVPSDGWKTSRTCLAGCLMKVLEEPRQSQRLMLSLSHSRGAGAAVTAVLTGVSSLAGIGIDCEPESRSVSSAVQRRIGWIEDVGGMDAISAWAIKEACFKADPEQTASLRDYSIAVGADGVIRCMRPSFEFEVERITHGGHCIVVAAAFIR